MANVTFTIRVPQETLDKLTVAAEMHGVTVAAIAREILDKGADEKVTPEYIDAYIDAKRARMHKVAQQVRGDRGTDQE